MRALWRRFVLWLYEEGPEPPPYVIRDDGSGGYAE